MILFYKGEVNNRAKRKNPQVKYFYFKMCGILINYSHLLNQVYSLIYLIDSIEC